MDVIAATSILPAAEEGNVVGIEGGDGVVHGEKTSLRHLGDHEG
jgi:hypothetical protein